MSKRQYITKASLASVMPTTYNSVTDEQINLAEEIIDSVVYTEIDNVLAPFIQNSKIYKGTCTSTTITISELAGSDTNKYTYTSISIMSGAKKGTVANVLSSDGGVLTIEEVSGLTGEVVVSLSQVGKFPRVCDTTKFEGGVYKLIPLDIEQAVKLQTKFIYEQMQNNNNIFTMAGVYESESIGTNYSYQLGRGEKSDGIGIRAKMARFRLVSPEVIPFIKKYIKS